MAYDLAEGLAEAFQLQAAFCLPVSPIYGEILSRCGADLEEGGVIARVFDGWVGRPIPDAVVLRLVGAAHRLVLRGDAPELARFFPSMGGTPEFPAAWEVFVQVVEDHFEYMRQALTQQVQTNEVSRCAGLIGGFRYIAEQVKPPLRLLEIGSSAGLNQNWDRYRYERDGELFWGASDSPVRIACNWHGEPPPLASTVEVVSRVGCDISPLDASDGETAFRLQSFIWPDQVARLQLLRAAIEVARRFPPAIEKSSAPPWLARQLEKPEPGVTTVVFHSIMWWYMSAAEREAVTRTIEEAGRRATAAAPIAWMQLELTRREQPQLTVRLWPGGEEKRLAHVHAHGGEVWWEEAPAI